ncbi:sodium:solute symporter family transporter [Wukongibacter sp. M2B1]|uniref:sodium:solute symporter family transporter n=1 Tax=Wukongibacter sp. M2B1 TaxID=3088895 RepID=UPI003D79784E
MSSGVKYLIMAFSFGMIIVSFLIGWTAKKKASDPQSFFGGTALFGPLTLSLSTIAAVASAFAIVGVPGIIYSFGNTMTLWMLSSGAFAMAYLAIGKKIRAMAEVGSIASLGDISDLRFNGHRGIKATLSVVLFLGAIAYLASQISATSALFAHLLGWNPMVAGFFIFGILTIYTALSGEVGGVLTQAFQGLIMVLAGIIMIIAFFSITGGFENIVEVVSNAGKVTGSVGGKEVIKEFSPDMLDAWGILPGSIAMTWMFIPILGTMGQPQVLTRMYALKDPKDMPRLGLYAALGHMIVGLFAVTMAYAALYLVGKGIIPPITKVDNTIFAVADYVGVYAQLFVYAAILAASMSTASMFLTLSSNIISRDLPNALGKKLDSKKQMQISRITTFIIGIFAIMFAIFSGEAVAILGTFGWGTLMSATFPVFITGLLWKRASSQGVFSGLITALILNVTALILNRTGFKWPGGLPWYVNVITAALVVTVVVSLCTKGATGNELDKRVEAVIDL